MVVNTVTSLSTEFDSTISTTIQRCVVSGVTLNGDSKLPIGVNESGNGCLSFCVSPAIDWRSLAL